MVSKVRKVSKSADSVVDEELLVVVDVLSVVAYSVVELTVMTRSPSFLTVPPGAGAARLRPFMLSGCKTLVLLF
ncbi:hypothetical protein GCM10027396_12590 [Insolitispirillum peregrinum]